jgi:hypothetical protein
MSATQAVLVAFPRSSLVDSDRARRDSSVDRKTEVCVLGRPRSERVSRCGFTVDGGGLRITDVVLLIPGRRIRTKRVARSARWPLQRDLLRTSMVRRLGSRSFKGRDTGTFVSSLRRGSVAPCVEAPANGGGDR